MATKSSTKTAKKATTKQDLLYIMSPQCGWCKKADPVVDELIKDGAKITILDVTNPEEGKRANDVKAKFSAQCGTPLFIDGESGNMKCGFAEKDVLQKWVNGEEIPKPPQPKSPPPPPPTDFKDEGQVNTFKEAYEKWSKENDHLPKILPVDQVLQRMEMAQQQRQQQGAPGAQGPQAGPPTQAPSAPTNNEGTGTGNVIVDNRLQILESKTNILEAKLDQVVSLLSGKNQAPSAPSAPSAQGPQAGPPSGRPTPGNAPATGAASTKLEEVRKAAAQKRAQLEAKSKDNKKTVKGL